MYQRERDFETSKEKIKDQVRIDGKNCRPGDNQQELAMNKEKWQEIC